LEPADVFNNPVTLKAGQLYRICFVPCRQLLPTRITCLDTNSAAIQPSATAYYNIN